MSRPRSRAAAALLTLAAAACSGGSTGPPITGNPPPPRPLLSPTYRPSGHMAAGDVFVHLFEWKWTDIAPECETVLGPAGFAAVQVSPPEEHSITPNHDWSERYQPVRYNIARSRSGTQAEFTDMVSRCAAVGVGIYVDAVINHMTNFPSPGIGSDSSPYSKYDYPGLYTSADFHPPCTVSNYADAANVQDCELFGLPDLNTGKDAVRRKIAAYLIMLARMGVAGFRIDAAKHIQQVELADILNIVDSTMTAEGRPIPYYFLEVSGGAGEALSPRDYFGEAYASGGAADITEFTFVGVGDKFRQIGGQHLRPCVGFERGRGGSCPRTKRWSSCKTTTPSTNAASVIVTATCSAWPTCGCWRSRTATRRFCRATRSTAPRRTRWARHRTRTAGPSR